MSNLEKKHLTADERERIISEWKQSGLSKKKFADQHGLKYYTFIAWFEKHGSAGKDPGFEQIKIVGEEKIFMEVVTGNRTLRFYQPLSKEYFTLLLQ